MGRPRRIHVPGATYYVQLQVHRGHVLLHDAKDISDFEQLVSNALAVCDARLHAFCWLPTTAHFAVQIADVPLSRLAHLIASPYSRRMHRRRGQRACLFRRYRAALLRDHRTLAEAVRYIHWAPVRAGLVEQPVQYPWSSDRTYRGRTREPWLTTATVKRLLATLGVTNAGAYHKWIDAPMCESEARRFERGSTPAQSASQRMRRADEHLTEPLRFEDALNLIIDAVLEKLDVSRAELLSDSSRHRVTMARALIGWHARRNAVGTVADIAHHLARDPSTLSIAINRYRMSHAKLFAQPVRIRRRHE